MESAMTIRFWGVRGSVPSPGSATARYGGNTSCVSVHIDGKVLVLDSGTGIRGLGKVLNPDDRVLAVVISHSHWDHIQGFPFFAPIYLPSRRVCVIPFGVDTTMMCSLLTQMDGAHFPLTPDKLPSTVEILDFDGLKQLLGKHIRLTRIALNHPGDGFGYRIESGPGSLVYLTDNELDPPGRGSTSFDEFVRFCLRADVLIHDAQFLEADMPHKRGWGHSLVSHACELAAAAKVEHLILYHHDPDRTDEDLDRIQESARNWFRERNLNTLCTAAFEGLDLKI